MPGPIHRWLLILGAGASVPAPTRLPAFDALSTGVLRGIGWRDEWDGDVGVRYWRHPVYPSFAAPAMAPEVLFGTLRRFRVEFAGEVARVLRDAPPNAVHDVAAQVLADDGAVWTTNVDLAVEAACRVRGFPPPRAGRAAAVAPGLLTPVEAAAAGTLVKLHGTAEAPATLAFTADELLAPLPRAETEHLAELAADRTVVLYGYAGADADLFALLDEVLRDAEIVRWFEPSAAMRGSIRRTFPDAERLEFAPAELPLDFGDALVATADAFLSFASDAGYAVEQDLAEALGTRAPLPPAPRLRLRQPSGVTHARIVERFGPPGADEVALQAARREDLRISVAEVGPHLRWALRRSVYQDGIAGKLIRRLVDHRVMLARLRPVSLRDYVITRACALLLQRRDAAAVEEFADWAAGVRCRANGEPYPTDLYYRAHGRRYALRVEEARQDAERAAAGLSVAVDPERHAGAVLESGCIAIYQGRFERARRYGFELRHRTGRYAIPRWQAWGAWLEAIALCHLRDADGARKALRAAEGRFEGEGRLGPVADVRTGYLLAARVDLAVGREADADLRDDDAVELGGRYRDDRDLVIADLLIGTGDADRASERLRRVAAAPSCAVADTWARLGLAEIARLDGDKRVAGDGFADVASLAGARGAWWMQAQAALGLSLCRDERAEEAWRSVERELLQTHAGVRTEDFAFGEPRALWMLTV